MCRGWSLTKSAGLSDRYRDRRPRNNREHCRCLRCSNLRQRCPPFDSLSKHSQCFVNMRGIVLCFLTSMGVQSFVNCSGCCYHWNPFAVTKQCRVCQLSVFITGTGITVLGCLKDHKMHECHSTVTPAISRSPHLCPLRHACFSFRTPPSFSPTAASRPLPASRPSNCVRARSHVADCRSCRSARGDRRRRRRSMRRWW